MIEIVDKVQAKLETLTAGMSWDDPAGTVSAMRFFPMGLQPKRMNAMQAEDAPCCEIGVRNGVDSSGRSTLLVDVVMLIYVRPDTDGDGGVDEDDDPVSAAREAIEQAIGVLRKLAVDDEASYAPYAIVSQKWQIGDAEGNQPGPDFYSAASLMEFELEPII